VHGAPSLPWSFFSISPLFYHVSRAVGLTCTLPLSLSTSAPVPPRSVSGDLAAPGTPLSVAPAPAAATPSDSAALTVRLNIIVFFLSGIRLVLLVRERG
jgi:hypothetical protein